MKWQFWAAIALAIWIVFFPIAAFADNDARCRAAFRYLGHLNPYVPDSPDLSSSIEAVIVIERGQFDRANTDTCVVASYQGVINGRHTILIWRGLLEPPMNKYLERNLQHELAHAQGWRH
ncbi:MAG: hypothetical protein WEB63_05395 [Cucumibacter sp.]